ncbi:hypothetical protein [Roseisolibacter sp. H3M3-2]|uniref:hypothetical protein n=1 Tax=Roseisolibacter sp. H3M3-2 TaxID=3031323 RepID=UPI0023DBFF9B|nr:hypothetical protein [Roseisolibacter sp. H3M3-2]MDF1505659.1 hypothetical protein [Roseisolibacter sp. H3M3-2]
MRRTRGVDVLAWGLCLVLAGLFLVSAARKLVGADALLAGIGPASAMAGYPAWARVVTALVEAAGAAALLFPPASAFGAAVLAALMVPAALAEYFTPGGVAWVPLAVLAALLVVLWARSGEVLRDQYATFAATPRPLLADGLLAGVIGATVIAVWFLIVDAADGRPFFTPTTLGAALVGAAPSEAGRPSAASLVLAYTVFHYGAFVLVGLAAALLVSLAEREPSVLLGFVLLFAVAEVGIYALVAILDVASPFGAHAWLALMIGNLLAVLAMGAFFWRRRSGLGAQFRRALEREPGTPDQLMAPPALRH